MLVLVGCERVGKGKGPIYVPAPPSNTDLSEDPYLPGLWTRVIAPCELKGGKFGMIAGDVDEHGVAHGHVAMTGLLGKLKPAVTHIVSYAALSPTPSPSRTPNPPPPPLPPTPPPPLGPISSAACTRPGRSRRRTCPTGR